MARRKTYQAMIYQQLDMYVAVPDPQDKNKRKKYLVQFRGGSLKPIPRPSSLNGIFTTDNPDVIAALDSHKGNQANGGKMFRCTLDEAIPDDKTRATRPAPATPEGPENPEGSGDEGKGTGDNSGEGGEGIKEVPEVTKLPDAKKYLLANVEGMTPQKLPNKKSILNAAAKAKISFPNLED